MSLDLAYSFGDGFHFRFRRHILNIMIPAATGEKLRQVRNTSGHLLAGALAVVLAGIGAGAPVSALSAADAPTAGSFLVATRDLQESWFSQTGERPKNLRVFFGVGYSPSNGR